MTQFVTIESGHITNRTAWIKFLHGLKDGRYEVAFKSKNKRTLPMNAYLHGVLIPEFRKALNEVGYNEVRTDAQAKEIIKQMFLKVDTVNENTGEVISYTKHTSDLTKEEMGVLFDEVIQFAQENCNYTILYPNQQASIYES